MKKITLTFAIVLFTLWGSVAQTHRNILSPYLEVSFEKSNYDLGNNILDKKHEVFYGLQYGWKISSKQRIQGYAAYSNFKVTSLGADYHYHLPLFLEGLSFPIGVGLGVDIYDRDSNSVKRAYGILKPQAGFNYKHPNSTVGFFATYKPKIALDGFGGLDTSPVQFGVSIYLR